MHKKLIQTLLILTLGLITLIGCSQPTETDRLTITVISDGSAQVLLVKSDVTVSDILQDIGITPSELDRVNPPGYNRVEEGMTITVVRVTETTEIIEIPVPFESRTALNDSLPEDETRLLQAGVNGVAEVTYRIVYEDGAEISRSEVRRVVVVPPQDEVTMVGSQSELETITVTGTLAYISGGNVWMIRQNSANRQPLTLDGGVDGRIFDLSTDGRRLLFSQASLANDEETSDNSDFNALHVILDTTSTESLPLSIGLSNILWAAWVPGTDDMIAYSTAEPRPSFPGWQANNDLWRARIAPDGSLTDIHQMIGESSGGIYGWYGTFFAFSPDGTQLAWAQPDAVGILVPIQPPSDDEDETPTPESDEEEVFPDHPLADFYAMQPLASFAPRNAYDFIWVPTVTWSPGGEMLITTTHGPPLSSETAEDSPVFNLTVIPVQSGYSIDLVSQAGMWSMAEFPPPSDAFDAPIAYLEAANPLDSVVSPYQLVIIDQDGSNRRIIFPQQTASGSFLSPEGFVWSPDGRQIALIYEGDLYLLDVISGLMQRLSGDGLSSSPQWTP